MNLNGEGLDPKAFLDRKFRTPVYINADTDSAIRGIAKAGISPLHIIPPSQKGVPSDIMVGS